MVQTASFTKTGTKSQTKASLPKAVFGQTPKDHTLLKQAYLAYLSNRRQNLARTKTRTEVRGGGRKPWRQKGTGRARAGSIRSPLWRGGGITFGPRGTENYSRRLPKAAKRLAIRQALSLKAADGGIVVIEDFALKEGKTKEALALLDKLPLERNVLLVVADKNELLTRATNNIARLRISGATQLSVFAVLNSDSLVITKPALKLVEQWLGGKNDSR